MNASVNHLLKEALALTPEERSALIVALLDSVYGEDEAEAAKVWVEEIERRREELRTDAAQVVTWAVARARLSAL